MALPRGGPSRLTWRRFRNFLNRLPAHSHYHTELRNSLSAEAIQQLSADHDPETEAWSRLESLAASIDERLQQLIGVVISACGGEAPELQLHYRPGVPRPEGAPPQSPEDRAAWKAAVQAQWDATQKKPPS